MDLFLIVVALVVVWVAIFYGLKRLFKKETSKYFVVIMLGIECYGFEEIASFVNYVCVSQTEFSVAGLIALFASFWFFLSSDLYLQYKIPIKDSKEDLATSLVALVFPVVLFVAIIFLNITVHSEIGLVLQIIFNLLSLPMLLSSFWGLKYSLLKNDEKNRVAHTRPVNLAVLAFYALNVFYLFLNYGNASAVVKGIVSVVMSVDLFVAVVFCVRGARKWEI